MIKQSTHKAQNSGIGKRRKNGSTVKTSGTVTKLVHMAVQLHRERLIEEHGEPISWSAANENLLRRSKIIHGLIPQARERLNRNKSDVRNNETTRGDSTA